MTHRGYRIVCAAAPDTFDRADDWLVGTSSAFLTTRKLEQLRLSRCESGWGGARRLSRRIPAAAEVQQACSGEKAYAIAKNTPFRANTSCSLRVIARASGGIVTFTSGELAWLCILPVASALLTTHRIGRGCLCRGKPFSTETRALGQPTVFSIGKFALSADVLAGREQATIGTTAIATTIDRLL